MACSHVRHMSYHMSQLRYQSTGSDMPLQKSWVAILVSLQECGFSRIYITLHRASNSAKSQAKTRFAFYFVERNNGEISVDLYRFGIP